jgi:hypothetical protein
MNGYFSQEAMEAFTKAVGEENFSESLFDFTRCVRPDGSAYGTSGKCKAGTEEAKQEETPKPKRAAKELKDGGSLTKVAKMVREKTAKKDEAAPAADKAKALEDLKKAQKAYGDALRKQIELSISGKTAEAEKQGAKVQAALKKWEKLQEAAKSPEKKAAEKRDKEELLAMKDKQAARDKAQLAAKLSPGQVKAIKDYTGDDNDSKNKRRTFSDVNECLRFPSKCKSKGESDKFAKELDGAIKALPKNESGEPFYRGVAANRGEAAQVYKALENAKPGTVLKDPGFGSYSAERRQTENFMSTLTPNSKNILFVSRSKGITPINKFSAIPSENEAILPRGTSQTIRSVRKEGGTLIVELD